MVNQAEVRESHEQFSAAWSLYARCSDAGEVVDMDGLRVANARQPWFLMNAALLTEPVLSQTHLAARAHAASEYFGREHRPWFLAGSQQWLGDGARETLARCGLTLAFTGVGMVAAQLAAPARPLPEVGTRRIDDERGRLALADLNAAVYAVSSAWVRGARRGRVPVASTVIRVRRVCRRRARVNGLHRAAPRRSLRRLRGHGARPPPPRSGRTRHAPQLGRRDPGHGHHADGPPCERRRLPRIPKDGVQAGR